MLQFINRKLSENKKSNVIFNISNLIALKLLNDLIMTLTKQTKKLSEIPIKQLKEFNYLTMKPNKFIESNISDLKPPQISLGIIYK